MEKLAGRFEQLAVSALMLLLTVATFALRKRAA